MEKMNFLFKSNDWRVFRILMMTLLINVIKIHSADIKIILPNERTLIMSNIIFTHSNIIPEFFYNGTLCPLSTYNGLAGELTNPGMNLASKLGKNIKERYNPVYSKISFRTNLNISKIYSKSSSMKKCQHSMQLLLFSLLDPKKKSAEWNANLNLIPFNIETLQNESDPVMHSEKSECLNLKKMQNEIKRKTKFQNLSIRHKDFLKILRGHIGNITSLEEIIRSFYTLENEYLSNKSKESMCKSIPVWLTDVFIEKFKSFVIEYYDLIYDGEDKKYAKLLGGPLLAELIQNMKNVISKNTTHKLFVYSGDDSTLYQILTALNIKSKLHFPRSFAIIMELYDDKEGNKTIEFLIHDPIKAKSEFINIEPTLCADPCNYENFLKNYENVISVNRKNECNNLKGLFLKEPRKKIMFSLSVVFGILLLIILLGAIYCCVKIYAEGD